MRWRPFTCLWLIVLFPALLFCCLHPHFSSKSSTQHPASQNTRLWLIVLFPALQFCCLHPHFSSKSSTQHPASQNTRPTDPSTINYQLSTLAARPPPAAPLPPHPATPPPHPP